MEAEKNLKLEPAFVHRAVVEATNNSSCTDESQKIFLTECLPVPEPGLVQLDAFHARDPEMVPGTYAIWFVTRGSPQSVFFDEKSMLFGCCWGPDKDTGGYTDLGYRSGDPVEMFFV